MSKIIYHDIELDGDHHPFLNLFLMIILGIVYTVVFTPESLACKFLEKLQQIGLPLSDITIHVWGHRLGCLFWVFILVVVCIAVIKESKVEMNNEFMRYVYRKK